MKRELAIVLGVLVPFAALVVLAWLWLAPSRATSAAQPGPAASTARATTPVITVAPQPSERDAAVAVIAPSVVDSGVTVASIPRAIAAPVAAVTPEVMVCFRDQRSHLHGATPLEVRFTPLPDGGFAGVRVSGLTHPLLAACVEDVFDEVSFTPTGAETFESATHTFVFDPSRE